MTRTSNHDYLIDDPSSTEFVGSFIDQDDLPRVSICIPSFNNEDTIERCLRSISGQDYPEIELILVDGGSDDATVEIAKQYVDIVAFDDGNLGSARQKSIELASGTIIGLFDSDIIFPHDKWLKQAVSRFNFNDNIGTVWPQNVAPPDGRPLTELYFKHWNLIIENRIESNRGLYGGGNSLFRRDCLKSIGSIDTDLHWGEDFDLAQKLKNEGYQVVYYRDPLYHDTMRSLSAFIAKQFTAANSFANAGFGIMNLSLIEILYEQVIIGFYGMFRGLFVEQDMNWAWFLPYFLVRGSVYGYTHLEKLVGR